MQIKVDTDKDSLDSIKQMIDLLNSVVKVRSGSSYGSGSQDSSSAYGAAENKSSSAEQLPIGLFDIFNEASTNTPSAASASPMESKTEDMLIEEFEEELLKEKKPGFISISVKEIEEKKKKEYKKIAKTAGIDILGNEITYRKDEAAEEPVEVKTEEVTMKEEFKPMFYFDKEE